MTSKAHSESRVIEKYGADLPSVQKEPLLRFLGALQDLLDAFCPGPKGRYMPIRPPGKGPGI